MLRNLTGDWSSDVCSSDLSCLALPKNEHSFARRLFRFGLGFRFVFVFVERRVCF